MNSQTEILSNELNNLVLLVYCKFPDKNRITIQKYSNNVYINNELCFNCDTLFVKISDLVEFIDIRQSGFFVVSSKMFYSFVFDDNSFHFIQKSDFVFINDLYK